MKEYFVFGRKNILDFLFKNTPMVLILFGYMPYHFLTIGHFKTKLHFIAAVLATILFTGLLAASAIAYFKKDKNVEQSNN